MRIGSLYVESISKMGLTIDEIIENLALKTLIVFSLKTTDINPNSPWNQIIAITAIAIDGGTGEQLDGFNEEADISLSVLRVMDKQEQAKRYGEVDEDTITIRDMLDAADYDLAARQKRGDEMSETELVVEFRQFVESFPNPVLLTYDATYAMHNLNIKSPAPFRYSIIDLVTFTKTYFVPVVLALRDKGVKRAGEMVQKMSSAADAMEMTIQGLGRAMGVGRREWRFMNVEEVQQVARIFKRMLKFLKAHGSIFQEPTFKRFAARQIQHGDLGRIAPD